MGFILNLIFSNGVYSQPARRTGQRVRNWNGAFVAGAGLLSRSIAGTRWPSLTARSRPGPAIDQNTTYVQGTSFDVSRLTGRSLPSPPAPSVARLSWSFVGAAFAEPKGGDRPRGFPRQRLPTLRLHPHGHGCVVRCYSTFWVWVHEELSPPACPPARLPVCPFAEYSTRALVVFSKRGLAVL